MKFYVLCTSDTGLQTIEFDSEHDRQFWLYSQDDSVDSFFTLDVEGDLKAADSAMVGNPFAESFMQPAIHDGGYFIVPTSDGDSVVPAFLINGTGEGVTSASVEELLDYISGTPDDVNAQVEKTPGVAARMSASGYTDCTDWTGYSSREAAYCALAAEYGE